MFPKKDRVEVGPSAPIARQDSATGVCAGA